MTNDEKHIQERQIFGAANWPAIFANELGRHPTISPRMRAVSILSDVQHFLETLNVQDPVALIKAHESIRHSLNRAKHIIDQYLIMKLTDDERAALVGILDRPFDK